MRFSAQRTVWSDSIELRMGMGANSVAQPIMFTQWTMGEISEPCITLATEDAQLLIDALYATGLRPSQAAGSAGQLAATQYHLEDMRKLVFNGK